MQEFYNGTKLLSLRDLNGNKPEIYICTSNRSAGKTTFFTRWAVKKFLKTGEKFCFIYRFDYELDNVHDKIFKDVSALFFPDLVMVSEKKNRGKFCELYLCKGDIKTPCGYAVSLNSADSIKKCSHLLSDISVMIFDEFQSETNNYAANEVSKFISLHTSIARGNGQQVRYLPVIMISNPITLLNPYYTELGISSKLTQEVKYLRGNGFVIEQGYNESAGKQNESSSFNTAFAGNKYVSYNTDKVYLNDNSAFIEKLSGNSRYIATLKYKGRDFALREFPGLGLIYCDDKPDATYPVKISLTCEDFTPNYVMFEHFAPVIQRLRTLFNRGSFRFKNLICKEAAMYLVAYR